MMTLPSLMSLNSWMNKTLLFLKNCKALKRNWEQFTDIVGHLRCPIGGTDSYVLYVRIFENVISCTFVPS